MSQENQSFLRFSLEESVWFQKGQEVADLLSISLDPNITIIENDQYVAIRGSLELTGEYKRVDEEVTEQEDIISAPKFVQSVEEREGGLCEFLHRFPVDITIPNNRIESVYDIDVSIDSFDYAVPERSCLRLVAELTISGLYGEQQNVPIDEAEPEQEFEVVRGAYEIAEAQQETDSYDEEEAEPIRNYQQEQDEEHEVEEEFEPLYRSEQEEHSEEIGLQAPSYSPNFILSYPNEVDDDTDDFDDDDQEPDQFDYQRPFSAEAKRQPEEEVANDSPFSWVKPAAVSQPEPPSPPAIPKLPEFTFSSKRSEQSPQQELNIEPSFESPDTAKYESAQYSQAESPELESSSSSSSPQEKKSIMQKLTKKKSMSISEFLGRKTDNELQAKLKVCIVQHGDTLDRISERYELPIQQIMRVNHLEANQDVYEGQVLYIPETAANK
ncbi:stage VI sporulation protein D [Bacillus sp. DNRA2]|uniref:stage VI sporulation protein D n=1 Tax=Bacillus sp. DNRA2 TaxID=2723053 RepID=UPI00145CAF14|nr:stage VI sporulation protein D [Bacillus sp. DNRA2]NMD70518.1 stage VI sporulation protein D [Bacillus sp. DNRA2]